MRSCRLVGYLSVALFLAGLALASDKQSGTQQSSNLRFTVVKDDNNKPVRNASVILHLVGKGGKQSKGGFQLKTDNEGKTESEGIPYGPLRIQVLSPGFQTFGEDYQINQAQLEITVKLKRPGGQYSVYENHGEKKPDDKNPPEQKPQ